MNLYNKYSFIFQELVKRDFKKKYKRTYLGMVWSMLGPLLQLVVMYLVFVQFFGNTTQHFMIYVFSGLIVFNYFKQSTDGGMLSLAGNADVIKNIQAPKYLFLVSANVSMLINFLLTLIIFLAFVLAEGLLHVRVVLILYPVICLLIFNIGVGLILSALFVFFRDIKYLYDIFTMMLMWLSAIFYPIELWSQTIQRLFLLNPIFTYIHYIRLVVIHGMIPSISLHLLAAFYALVALTVGGWFYKRYNYRFIYHM